MEFKNIIARSWKHHFWTNAATTAVLTLSFAVLGSLWLGSFNMGLLMERWGQNIQLTIYLKDTATKEEIAGIEAAIKNSSVVQTVQFVGKENAAETFKASLASYGPNFLKSLSEDNENPFPASFFVTFKEQDRHPAKIESSAKELAILSGVEDVSYGEEWISNYNTLMRIVKVITLVVGLALFTGALFTVSNSIRASLSARREEIEILELVGATQSEI